MKKAISILCLLTAFLLLCGCAGADGFSRGAFKDGKNPPRLERSDVESVKMRFKGKDGKWVETEFSNEDISELIRLFNGALVKLADGGTTPDFSLEVTLGNGTVFDLIDQESYLELQFKNEKLPENADSIKLYSEELFQFVKSRIL